MPEGAKYFSREEIEVNRILTETKFSVTKTESDIKKLSDLGTPELQLNPPGSSTVNPQQLKKDIDSLKENIVVFKSNAFKQVEKVIENLPDKEQNYYRGIATKELYPEKSIKENDKDKITNDESFGTRFTQSLAFSKFLQKEDVQPEKSLRDNFKTSKDASGKEKD